MKKLLLLLFILLKLTVYGQNLGPGYFAKVPTRYDVPGLSPLQSIKLGYLEIPGNKWLKKAGEVKMDLFRIKLSKRFSIVTGMAVWGSFNRQKKELYTINDEKAYERTNYYYIAPSLSTGISYGFFFPYFFAARFGVFKPWEAAYYQAYIPVQYSGSNDIETQESRIHYSESSFGEIQQYILLELYRPFRSRFPHKHPIGWSIGYCHFLDKSILNKHSFNAGIYWHIKAK